MIEQPTRRTYLSAIGAVGIGALAGCSSDTDGGSSGGTPDGEANATTTTESGDESSSGNQWAETSTVDMTDGLAFEPKRIEVEAGTTVTWKNVGAIGHTVTAYEDEIPADATYFASGAFDSQQAAADGYPDSGNIGEGETYEHTFETKGTYKYYCIPHEMNEMIGYVKVV
jgi:plastocyanin